jgi:hypothetical protein
MRAPGSTERVSPVLALVAHDEKKTPDEQVIDLLHKAIYAFVTGKAADTLIVGPPRIPVHRTGWTSTTKEVSKGSEQLIQVWSCSAPAY